MRFTTAAVAAGIVAVSACAREAPRFSLENARAHVEMLADTIGSRPIGTPANARARAYIVDQLRLFGYDVRVQEIDARRPELGRTAHVSNIIATKAGGDPRAIGLVSHYDSVPESPGAADDAFGVAVSLEAARVLAARADRRHTLMVLITDGEESGLMGAAGLIEDRDVMDRLHAYINVEAVGSAGTGVLFQTGPGNGWIVKPWAHLAPH
ncbi:MAG TPA: M20/M25/M40 family metallo-hydrolase, partial [Vicinamibacterales bacterium]